MYESALVHKLKQTNTSVDVDKTRERVEAIWKSAKRSQKKEIEELAGVSRASIQRSYRIGNISAKIVVALAQILNVNPFYLTGESDENTPCTDVLLEQYLTDKGYAKLLGPAKRKTRAPRKAKETTAEAPAEPVADELPETPEVQEPEEPAAPEPLEGEQESYKTTLSIKKLTPELEAYISALSEDELVLLLKAMLLRAKADDDTNSMAMMVKLLLLS